MKHTFWAIITAIIFISGCEPLEQPSYTQPKRTSVYGLREKAVNVIHQGLADPDSLIRTHAIEVVSRTASTEFMPKVVSLLKDDFVLVKFAAAITIGDMKYSTAKTNLENLLADENQNVQIAAAYAMAKMGRNSSAKIIRNATKNRDQTIRANAALLLGKLDDPAAIELLYQTLYDKSSSAKVRFQTVEAIAMLGDEKVYPKLWTMLISAYADDRVMGVRAMGALGTIKARNALLSMLDDAVIEVRLAAAEQLGAMGDKTGQKEVLDYFTRRPKYISKLEVERKNVLAALAIGRIGTTKLKAFLPKLLSNESKAVRLAAAQAVLGLSK